MHNCHDCKKDGTDKKYENLSSRVSSMRWHMDDYDRMKGKGKFKKDHPDDIKRFHGMLDEKTKMLSAHMGHDLPAEKKLEEKPPVITVGSYSG